MLARSLAPAAAPALSPADRLRALCYLGAAQLFRGRRDSAEATFRRLIRAAPRYQPDDLVFPPQVTDLFESVRRAMPVLAIVLPAETTLGPREGRLTARVVTSVPQPVQVIVRRVDKTGPPLTLYDGAVVDSLVVGWDGALVPGESPAEGRYVLDVVAVDSGRPHTRLEVPLTVSRAAADTVPVPAAPALPTGAPSASAPASRGLRSLAFGLLAGAAAATLPALISPHRSLPDARFAVGVSIGTFALVGLLAPPRVAASAAQGDTAGAAALAEWRRGADSLRALNRARRAEAPFVIRASAPQGEDARP